MKFCAHVVVIVQLLVGVISCGANPAVVAPAQPPFAGLPAGLPDDSRQVSATSVVFGSQVLEPGPGAVPDDTAITLITSDDSPVSYAMYGFFVSETSVLNSLELDVSAVSGEYWIGLSDYGVTNAWQWHGPFTAGTQIDFGGDADRYLSPDKKNFFWMVVTAGGSSIRLEQSVVDFSGGLQFRVPPPGLQFAAPSPALNPALVLMPEIEGLAQQDAPVIFYTVVTGGESSVHFASFNGSNWVQLPFNSGVLMSHALPFRQADSGAVVAFDIITQNLKLLETNDAWEVIGDSVADSPGGVVLAQLRADFNAADGSYAIAGSFTQADEDEVRLVTGQPGGWINEVVPVPGERVFGLDIQFNPVSGLPQTVYSHGTADTSETFLLDTALQVGSFDGTGWSFDPADHNTPMFLDLQFLPDGTPRIAMVSARDFIMDIPFPPIYFAATLYYDIVVGTYNGAGWSYNTVFVSELDPNPFGLVMEPVIGIDCAWSAADELIYATSAGIINFQLSPEFAITGGNMTNSVEYLEGDDGGGGGFSGSDYFTGDPGISFSWHDGPDGPVCAYVRADGLDVDALVGGDVDLSNELYYWSP